MRKSVAAWATTIRGGRRVGLALFAGRDECADAAAIAPLRQRTQSVSVSVTLDRGRGEEVSSIKRNESRVRWERNKEPSKTRACRVRVRRPFDKCENSNLGVSKGERVRRPPR